MSSPLLRRACSALVVCLALSFTGAPLAASAAAPAALPPLPAPLGVPTPGPKTDGPYAPQPILPGGVVVPLYPPGSPELDPEKVREPEVYQMWGPTLLGAVVSIHNPSIEFHAGHSQLNTGAAIILAAGGGHRSLNVGSEAAPFVPFFANHGINTIILRNRLRSDGYDPRVHGVNDALQAVKLVRAYAKEWNLDPEKIGLVGFSAGAELAAAASLFWEEFDRKHDVPGNPFAKVSSRPDFQGIIYPGPSPFARGGNPPIPRATPPAFIATPGWGDRMHAIWATEYFNALLYDGVPNVEMHIYAR
ncbi:MAG TPA: alpha/beta hydrolase fold domain-containing protein, partial [Opitutus sp.]|nr:alpha/beta hydrolase fold domain-containing protein [Opitutus sp.]